MTLHGSEVRLGVGRTFRCRTAGNRAASDVHVQTRAAHDDMSDKRHRRGIIVRKTGNVEAGDHIFEVGKRTT